MLLAIKELQFYIIFQSGSYKENIKPAKEEYIKKKARKQCYTCLSQMYVNKFEDGHVEVEYISTHTSHTLSIKYPPLQIRTKEEVAMKLSLSVNPNCILNLK